MKRIQCREIEGKILQGIPLSNEEEIHLLGCRECQHFSAVCQMLAEDACPSRDTDRKVMARASEQLSAIRHAPRATHRPVSFFRFVGGIAALLLAVFMLSRLVSHSPKPSVATSMRPTAAAQVQRPANEKTASHEAILLFFEDTSENLDTIEYELASTGSRLF